MLTNSSRRSENEVQIYACNAQIAYIDNTKSRARRYTSKRVVRLGNMYIPIGTLFSKKIHNVEEILKGSLDSIPSSKPSVQSLLEV